MDVLVIIQVNGLHGVENIFEKKTLYLLQDGSARKHPFAMDTQLGSVIDSQYTICSRLRYEPN